MKFEGGLMRLPRAEKSKAPEQNPYADWSDAERQDEFMETGNAACLTPELARKMQLPEELLAEVPEVAEAAITAVRGHDTENAVEWDSYFEQEVAKLAAIDIEDFKRNPCRTALFLLTHRDDPAYTEFVRSPAGDDLYRILIETARSAPQAFSTEILAVLDFSHAESFATAAAALELVRNLYIELFHKEQDELDVVDYEGDLRERDPQRFAQLTAGSEKVTEVLRHAIEDGSGSYLLNARAREVLGALEARELMYETVDSEPFLIAPDVYAGFNRDKSRLYLAPHEYNAKVAAYLALQGSEKNSQHYDGLYSYIVDPGEPVDVGALKRMGIDATAQDVRDFYFLQSEPIRERIKRDFEIEISSLSIPEQFQLLTFLKAVEKKDASPLLLQATQRLRKMGALRLEDIRGGTLDVAQGGTFDEKDRAAMLEVQRSRYEAKYSAEEFAQLRAGLAQALESQDTRFYLYRKDGTIVTFVRFDVQDEGKHMASFLTNPDFEGGSLGQAMLEMALEREGASGSAIHAECDPSLVPFYERFGFRLVRGPYMDAGGVETCDIVRDAMQPEYKQAA